MIAPEAPRPKSRYSVVPSRIWRHTSGRTASIFGAVPYVHDAASEGWTLVNNGFTIYDAHTGTYGCGRPAFPTYQAAQAFCDTANAQ